VVNYAVITSFRMIFEERREAENPKDVLTVPFAGRDRLDRERSQKYIRPGGETKTHRDVSVTSAVTTMSEGLTADELVLLLNEYLAK